MLKARYSRLWRHPWLPSVLLGSLGLGGLLQCSRDDEPANYITMRELDAVAQPTGAELGVLVAVSAQGGDVVRLDVSGGTAALQNSGAADTLCVHMTDVSAFVVAVHPLAQEAVVHATLGKLSSTEAPANDTDQSGASHGRTISCSQLSLTPVGGSATLVVSLGRAAPSSAGSGGSATASSSIEGTGGMDQSNGTGGTAAVDTATAGSAGGS